MCIGWTFCSAMLVLLSFMALPDPYWCPPLPHPSPAPFCCGRPHHPPLPLTPHGPRRVPTHSLPPPTLPHWGRCVDPATGAYITKKTMADGSTVAAEPCNPHAARMGGRYAMVMMLSALGYARRPVAERRPCLRDGAPAARLLPPKASRGCYWP